MKVYVVIETCCMHFCGVYRDKAEADSYAEENGYSVYEYEL